MLKNRIPEDKTYEELLLEALMQIPFYSEEWTNFQPSDPGITILENLTAFEVLQGSRIHEVTPLVLKMLLRLVGFEARKGKCARILLAAEGVKEPLLLPANQKFKLGDLCFETNRSILLESCHLMGVYSLCKGKMQNLSHLIDREVKMPAYLFSKPPETGDCLFFTMDALPKAGEELIFYVTAADSIYRNPFGQRGDITFAELVWECYTCEGFVKMHVRDDTAGLLVSGELRMRLPNSEAIPYKEAPDGGYTIRATLTKANYDVCPKLVQLDGFLFEAWQKETLSACYTFNRISSVSLPKSLLEDSYITVFCKEEKGSSYKKYETNQTPEEKGRFYETREKDSEQLFWIFDKRKYGYAPAKLKNAVKILIYQEEIMRRYALGKVLGCDHQKIALPAGHIVAESFCIIARRMDEQGDYIYDFVRPGRYGESDLGYNLYENDGYIIIEEAGDYIGADLYMGAFSVMCGAEGNIRADNQFTAKGLPSSLTFYNPKPGVKGCYLETLDDVKKRFLTDLKGSSVAVTESDYEKLVMETPKLCIQKVKAYRYGKHNLIRIAVMPGTEEAFPGLSSVYRQAIERQLEDRRLLTTRIEIVEPVYTPIDVKGTIYVKPQYENSLEIIEEVIRKNIDYIHSKRNFGEVLKFEQVFHEIESLDCVEFIYELSLHPQNPSLARLLEADIVPNENCLCYVGTIQLQTG